MKDIGRQLRQKLETAVNRHKAEAVLFSGGLDSSVVAAVDPAVKAFTVSLGEYGEDIKYAASITKILNMEHHHQNIEIEEAISVIPEVIKILKTFDPAIPNDLVVYFGLKLMKERGIKNVLTGDGSDELFGGYSFMREVDDLDEYIRRLSKKLRFNSNIIGDFFDMDIKQPYIESEVVELALKIPKDLKIKAVGNEIWGKWILRKAFEDILPPEFIWQNKRPLEYGSGMTELRSIIENRVSDEEYSQAVKKIPVKFISKEHYYYYRIYKDVIGEIPNPRQGEDSCSGCGAGMPMNAFHCKTCGYVITT